MKMKLTGILFVKGGVADNCDDRLRLILGRDTFGNVVVVAVAVVVDGDGGSGGGGTGGGREGGGIIGRFV